MGRWGDGVWLIDLKTAVEVSDDPHNISESSLLMYRTIERSLFLVFPSKSV